MKVTPEVMAKLEQCQSAEEVMELAKRENVTITMEQARKAFELLSSDDLSDDLMAKVNGGDQGIACACFLCNPHVKGWP